MRIMVVIHIMHVVAVMVMLHIRGYVRLIVPEVIRLVMTVVTWEMIP